MFCPLMSYINISLIWVLRSNCRDTQAEYYFQQNTRLAISHGNVLLSNYYATHNTEV